MKCRLLTLFVVCILVNICCAQTTILVDTGQTNCYNAAAFIAAPQLAQPFYGQDAQYSGRQPSYKDNGDGTVSDINTGLMWIRKSPTYKYTWTDVPSIELSGLEKLQTVAGQLGRCSTLVSRLPWPTTNRMSPAGQSWEVGRRAIASRRRATFVVLHLLAMGRQQLTSRW